MRIVFTFDDNNKSNKIAAKILNRLGLQGVFLLNDSPNLEEEVKMLMANNQIIGNHTKNHRRMSLMSDKEFDEEVVAFNEKLKSYVGSVEWFSYPWSDRPASEYQRKKLKEMFPNILRGVNGKLSDAENSTGDILRIPVKPHSFEELKRILLENNGGYLQLHGITGDQDWDINFEYFFNILNFFYRINQIPVAKDGDIHKILAVWNLRTAKKILDGLQIPFCLFLGSVLGAYRDKDFCPGDVDDIDLALHLDNYAQIGEIESQFLKYGFVKIHHWESQDKIAPEMAFEKQYGGVRSKIDLFFLTPEGDKMRWRFYKSDDGENHITKEIGAKYFSKFNKTDFYGVDFNIPCDTENYLKDNYGDWRTPIHRDNFSWEKDNKCKEI